MKRLLLGIVIFAFITFFFGQLDNLEFAMNVTGIIGLGGILVSAF